MLVAVFAIGWVGGAVFTNVSSVQDTTPAVIPGDADLAPVVVVEDTIEDTPEPVVPEPEPVVQVCPVVEQVMTPKLYSEITVEEASSLDFSTYGPEYAQFPAKIPERPSPRDRIKEWQIQMSAGSVTIQVDRPILAGFADTNSMDPVLDAKHNAIEIIPRTEAEIQVGDIVSYRTDWGTMSHRVTQIGKDSEGWYAIFQGDNNPVPDPGRIRFNQIERVVVAIIY
jgi:hypothetical protein